MNCYTHQELPALGICKHCQKGICMECLHDTEDGIACKGKCSEEVIAINRVIEHNKTVIGQTRGNFTSAGILYSALGGVFLLGPLLYFRRIDPFPIAIGSLFLVYGIYTLVKGQAMGKNKRVDF